MAKEPRRPPALPEPPSGAKPASGESASPQAAGARPGPPKLPAGGPPATPFAAADDEWESELAAWDANIPIVPPAANIGGTSSAAAPPLRHRRDEERHGAGVVPDEENPFVETPTTVVSPGQLLDLEDLPDMFSAGTFDDGLAPASGSYAALVATDQSSPGVFDREPAPEPPPSFPTDTLREMSARPWSDDLASLIALGKGQPVATPPRAYWETLAQLLSEERSLEGTSERSAALCLAAARVADVLGDSAEANRHLEALLAIDSSSPAAHRARLGIAERAGRVDGDEARESLSRLALTPHADQPYYRSLYAEWTLSRAARGLIDGTAAAAVASIPDGLARMLGDAELAWRDHSVAAALLENAGHRVGGGLGAAFLFCAAGLNELAHDFQAAAEQRFVAARLDEQRSLTSLGALRDLARLEPEAVVAGLEDVMVRLPPSRLKGALARWGAAAAIRAGDRARAWRMVADREELGVLTPGLARDRLDLRPSGSHAAAASAANGHDGGVGPPPALGELTAALARTWSDPTAQVCVALRVCELASTGDEVAFALEMAEAAGGALPKAVALGPAAERLAWSASSVPGAASSSGGDELRVRALRLWRQLDPARWTAASLSLAEALPAAVGDSGAGPGGQQQTRETVLREIAARDATSPAFWELASLAAQRGQFLDAATELDRGVARRPWKTSPLAAPLSELAGELTARADLTAAAARLRGERQKSGPQQASSAASSSVSLSVSSPPSFSSSPSQPVPMPTTPPPPTLTPAPVSAAPRLTLRRVLRELGDRDLWAEYVDDELAAGRTEHQSQGERMRRAALLLEPVFWRTDGNPDRGRGGAEKSRPDAPAAGGPQAAAEGHQQDDEDVPALAAAALDIVPLHPAAFALVLGARPDSAMLVERLVGGRALPGGERWLLVAAMTAAVAGDVRRALALASEARAWRQREREQPAEHQRPDLSRAIDATLRRLAWAVADPHERARLLRELADADGSADALVEAAEATEAVAAAGGEGGADLRAEARRLLEAAAFASGDGAVAADVRVGLERLAAGQSDLLAVALVPSSRDASRATVAADRRRERDRLRLLEASVRAERWDEVVTSLVDAPPHEDKPGPAILALAAAIDEGRGTGSRAPELWACARAALVFTDPQGPADNRAAGSIDSVAAAMGFAPESAALLRAADRSDAAELAEAGSALERLAQAAAGVADQRSAALLLVQAAGLAARLDPTQEPGTAAAAAAVQQRCLEAAVSHDPTSAVAAMAWRRWLLKRNRLEEAAAASAAEAEALVDPSLRVQALVRAARLSQAVPGAPGAAAAAFLRRALEIEPHDHDIFTRLRDLYEDTGRHAELADLLATRLDVTSNPFEMTALRLARADIFADALGDRARAKEELEAILHKEPQHARALARLADLEQEDGNDARAADLLIRRAFIERSPEKLRDLFLRLGRIYTQRIPDAKRAVGAYARVLQLDANSREALDELSGLYLGLGETKSAIAITERLVRIEAAPELRSRYHIRLAQLAERAGDPRSAALHFRRAAEEAPRDVEALGELVRHLEKVRDTAGRRSYLDHAASDLRVAVFADPFDIGGLEALIAVLRWRGRGASAAACAELLAMVRQHQEVSSAGGTSMSSSDWSGAVVPAWATPPAGGRSLAALARPAVDEETFPAAVPSSVRHLFRLLAPALWEGAKVDLARYRVDRGNRLSAGRPPRDVFDLVGAELAAGPFDMYLAPVGSSSSSSGAAAVVLVVEPGKPPAIIIGASLMQLGPAALRFAAGRSLRLISTHLDGAIAEGPAELGLWIGAVVRQFMGDYRHPLVPQERLAARAARVGKLLPRKLRQEIMPFAMESSGQLDLEALHAGIRDGANRVGLLASGSLAAALRVVLMLSAPATAGAGGSSPAAAGPPLAELGRNAEAQALLAFALSDAYDDLVKALE